MTTLSSKKISQLVDGGSPASGDDFVIQRGAGNFKIAWDALVLAAALGVQGTFLDSALNLSDVADVPSSRANLGLGSMALEATAAWLSKAGNLAGLVDLPTSRTNLGLGAGDSPTFTRMLLGDGAANAPSLAKSSNGTTGLWFANNTTIGVAHNGVQTGQLASAFWLTPAGTSAAPGVSVGAANTGLYLDTTGGNNLRLSAQGSNMMALYPNIVHLGLTSLRFGGGVGSADVLFAREAAGIMAWQNGTAGAVTHYIYNSRTDGSNFERAIVGWVSNDFVIGCDAGLGTGSNARKTVLRAMSGSVGFEFQFGTTAVWKMATGANSPLFPANNGTQDFGGAGNQIKGVYALGVITRSAARDPLTTDIADGSHIVWKNTAGGTLKLWANDGGTMKSVALA